MRSLSFVVFLAVAASSLAQTKVAGSWNGKIVLDKAMIPKGKDAKEQAAIDAKVKEYNSARISLVLKADNTFTSKTNAGQNKTMEGKWSISGNKLTLSGKKLNGKELTGKLATATQVFDISKDGKSMSSKGNGATLVFTRG